MKQEMKSTARLAVTAGLCTSLALGGLPLEAIAAEVVVEPAPAEVVTAASATEDSVEGLTSSDPTPADDTAVNEGVGESDGAGGAGDSGDTAATGGEAADEADSAGTIDGVSQGAATTISAASAFVADPKSTDVAQVIAADGTVQGSYGSLNAAVDAAQDGDTVKLLSDVTLEGFADDMRYGLGVKKGITLDGGGNTVDCGEYGRGIYVKGSGDANCPRQVTFMNVTITNHVNEGRCIDTRGGYFELTLDDVHLETTGTGNNQALTIGGDHRSLASGHLAPVVITGKSTIEAGDAGYGILTFNPVDLSIVDESKIDGYAALYLKGKSSSAGSSGSKIRVADKATICSRNVHNDESSTFGTVVFEDKGIGLEIDGATARASTDYVSQVIFGYGVDITGCSVRISGDSRVELAGDEATFADEPTGGAIEISGGTFNFKLEDRWCAPDFKPVDNGDGTFGVAEKEVAQIGDKTYPSLAKAIDSAQSGDTIQILEDCEYVRQDIVGKELTVDLCGHVLTSTKFGFVVESGSLTLDDTSESKTGTIRVVESGVNEIGVVLNEGGSFTMKGGSIESAERGVHANSGDGIVISIEGGSITAPNGIFAAGKGTLGSTKVFVKDGDIKAENAAILTNGSSPGGVVIDISGGTLEATDEKSTAVYLPGVNGKTTITGGTITGATGVEVRAGDLFISGNPRIQGSGELTTKPSANGGTTTGVGVAVAQHTTGEPINVVIEGDPIISGKYALYEHNPQGNAAELIKKVTVEVADGTFESSDPNAEAAVFSEDIKGFINGGTFKTAEGAAVDESAFKDLCAENYEPKVNADGSYTVEVPAGKRVAEIDGRAYPSVQEALDAAKDGQTVKLIKDTELMDMVKVSGKSVVFDLGGKTLKQAVDKFAIVAMKGADLTIHNGFISSDFGTNAIYAQQATIRTEQLTVNADSCIQVGNHKDDEVYWGELILGEGTVLNAKITGVTVVGPYASDGIPSEGARLTKLTVSDGVTIAARDGFAVAGNGAHHGTEINIVGGRLTSEHTAAVYHPQLGALTVSGGSIAGVSGIEIRSGELRVSGDATIKGTGSFSVSPNDSGTTTSGVGIAIAQHNTKLPISVEVDGAPKVSGVYGLYESNPQGNSDADLEKVEITVKGGTFETTDKKNGAPVQSEDLKGFVSGGSFNEALDADQCADGYGPVQQPDGSFGVSTEQSYTVKHLFEAVDRDDYVEDELLAKTETLTGTIGEDTAAEAATVEGFTAQEVTQEKIAADGKTVVEIKYDRTRHTVSFDSKGGADVTEQTGVKYGAKATAPADPTKQGSTFLGWYVSGTFNKFDFKTPLTEDIHLVAHWVLNTYTVTLDANGGEPIDPIEMSHGYELSKPTATRTGYTLTGWNGADGEGVTFPVAVTGDLKLTAQWELDAPTVTLTADKAEPGVHAGDTVTLTANPTHALDGVTYTYQWYKGREKIDGATEKTLEVSNEDGEYTVDVVAHDGKNASAVATSNSITLSFEKQGVAVSFAQSEVEKHANEIGATFVNGIALQACAIGGVSYESGDNAVATVDAKTGEVTIKGVGEVIITAKVAETETHKAAEASYKLTVTDHDAGTWKTVKPATCTEAGEEQRVCGVCNEVLETRAIEKLAHKASHTPATPATCTEPGTKAHFACAACGELFWDKDGAKPATEGELVIPAVGHDYAEIVVEPTCTEGGYTVHECQRCGDSYTDSKTDALGHTEELVGAVEATCTKDGYTGDKVCSTCGEVLEKGEAVSATGHKDGTWKVTKEATCTEPGERALSCSVCGEIIRTEAIAAAGHAWGAWKAAKEPTCTEAGREERTCSTCGEKESRELPALGHKLEAVAEVAATIDAAGTKAHYRCAACGTLFLDAEGKQGVDAADLVIEKLEAVTVTFDDCIDPKDDHVVVRIAKGGVISAEDLPADPQLAGYEFSGWFLYDAATGTWGDAFDPTAPVTSDLLVGAKWKKLDDGSGEGGSTEKPADKPTKPTDKPGSKPGSGDKDALVQTGDNAFAQIAAAFSAGIAAIGAGLFSRRRRSE